MLSSKRWNSKRLHSKVSSQQMSLKDVNTQYRSTHLKMVRSREFSLSGYLFQKILVLINWLTPAWHRSRGLYSRLELSRPYRLILLLDSSSLGAPDLLVSCRPYLAALRPLPRCIRFTICFLVAKNRWPVVNQLRECSMLFQV